MRVISIITIMIFLYPPLVQAEEKTDADNEYFRSSLRQQEAEKRLQPSADVRPDNFLQTQPAYSLSGTEFPCVSIRTVSLSSDTPSDFRFLIRPLLKKVSFRPGMCLGAEDLQKMQTAAQNILISKGLITSRIVIRPQTADTGSLSLSVIPGRLAVLRFEENDSDKDSEGRISAFPNKFPVHENGILNLRDLEQGLENLRRLPGTESNIRIEPAEEEDTSNVIVEWRQTRPVRISAGIDDSGSRTTGKYQGSVAVSFDNPFGLSDLFYVNVNRDLGRHKVSYTDAQGIKTDSGTRGYSLHYSFPAGYWLFTFNHNTYRYHEAVEGYSTNYDYNGKSRRTDFSIGRTVYRDGKHKTAITGKIWHRSLQKYIDDTEIEVQRRRTAGWALAIQHRSYWRHAALSAGLEYKRGTGMSGSLKAPEEFNDDQDTVSGTSRMKVVSADLDLDMPVRIGKQIFSLNSGIHLQWNKSPLTVQDKLAIGGRYTVRGFDGEQSLVGERGWFWQNNLNWHYAPSHQVYLGLDAGRVSGASAKYLPGRKLIGAVIGVKGFKKAGGTVHYDVFAGKPFSKPEGFQTTSPNYGFSLNYSF